MIKSMFNSPISSDILQQAVTDVIKAVAIEETALSNILNLESAIIQKAKIDSANLEEFVSINESVNNIIRNITEVQITTQIKLQFVEELLQKIENLNENDDLEE
jgi:hypothetical protein